jgi:hypothetical protein
MTASNTMPGPAHVGNPAISKPIASLSCDLDNKWAYMQTRGDEGWQSFPSYLELLVPRLLSFFQARRLAMTVFIVGRDAACGDHHGVMRAIAGAGHEIGNHSFQHEPWLHLYSEAQIERELARAEESIERATGQRPVGFRGPGYSLSAATLRVLARRGYLYDATTLPNILNPLTRAYFLMTSRLSREEVRRRDALFGSFLDGFRPLKPYRWRLDHLTLLEIPVTTVPIVKVPFHVSYILYLSEFSRGLALAYFRTALMLCRLTGTQPSLLLHSLDFLGGDEVPEVAFFPGMKLPLQAKLQLVHDILDLLCRTFTVVTMREHAAAHADRTALRMIEANL